MVDPSLANPCTVYDCCLNTIKHRLPEKEIKLVILIDTKQIK